MELRLETLVGRLRERARDGKQQADWKVLGTDVGRRKESGARKEEKKKQTQGPFIDGRITYKSRVESVTR
jgi:hypothetical protein